MPLILAIEPDRRQAAQLSAVVKRRLDVELVLVDTTQRALEAIGNRMPDLVLVPALLSPQDDAALAAALRVIAAAAHVQMLTIPQLGSARAEKKTGGVLSALRRGKSKAADTVGCDPDVFADQIASYLEKAGEERLAAVAEEAESVYEGQDAAAAPVTNQQSESTDGSFSEFVDDVMEPDSPVLVHPSPHEFTPDNTLVTEVAPVEETVDQTVRPAITFAVPPVVAEPSISVGVSEEEPARGDSEESVFSDADVPGPALAKSAPHAEIVEEASGSVPDETVSLALEEAVRALFASGHETIELATLDAVAEVDGPIQAPPIDVPSEVQPENAPLWEVAEITQAPDVAETTGVFELGDYQGVQREPVVLAPEPPEVELVTAPETEVVQTEVLPTEVPATRAEQKDEWESLQDLINALDAMPLAAIEATSPDEWIAPVASTEPERPVEKLEAVAPRNPEPEVQPASTATRSEREWVALIESLRHDVERLRTERAEKPAKKAAAPRAAKSEAKPEKEKEKEKEKKTKPIQDEWGFFDPEQCGFAALLAKLDEVTDPDEQQWPSPDPPRRPQ